MWRGMLSPDGAPCDGDPASSSLMPSVCSLTMAVPADVGTRLCHKLKAGMHPAHCQALCLQAASAQQACRRTPQGSHHLPTGLRPCATPGCRGCHPAGRCAGGRSRRYGRRRGPPPPPQPRSCDSLPGRRTPPGRGPAAAHRTCQISCGPKAHAVAEAGLDCGRAEHWSNSNVICDRIEGRKGYHRTSSLRRRLASRAHPAHACC
jgi:hypothetical protein